MPTPATSSSPRCAPFARRSGEQRGGQPPPAPVHAPGQGCGRPLGRAAGFVGGGIAAAFFASLERCYCVELRTNGDELLAGTSRDVGEAEAAPLLPAGINAAKKSSQTRAAGTKGKNKGGFWCCEN